MRKSASIALLLFFSFYQFGYYYFYLALSQNIEENWSHLVYSDDFAPNALILEVPISIPYMTDQEEFSETNLTFSKDGKRFRAIKQRYANDTLQLVYTPDTAQNTLDMVVKNWVSSLTGEQLPNSPLKNFVYSFHKDFTFPDFQERTFVLFHSKNGYPHEAENMLIHRASSVPSPPPEV
ncbi:hypothetical protein KIH41_06580 [Litoribacter ruber]|uniref:Uncharacterized protein n=1 Tax=Litoribacter ruber TaxID=702568 RepID=A0AAP2G0B0_9BACT|nr:MULTISPECIES: hypothetical protein [Litoribacter]MBS9522424.1 hypothetical protein [Litoribacter alkaliphilus]MBT0810944.1 hypothetical protein [Litoribacter ruber]